MNIVIIGAGVVGLHCAAACIDQGHDVIVLDQAPYLGEHTSGRNSGVIHAGIYYQPDTLKEIFCIEGNPLTYEWLKKLRVPHKDCGKWVVPHEGQETDLVRFYEKLLTLPIPQPELLNANQVSEREPALFKTQAIFIPSTGTLDASAYLKAMEAYLSQKNVSVILNCQVTGIENQTLITTKGPVDFDLAINSAGLFADEIAALSGLQDYQIKPCRGDYFTFHTQPLKSHVYSIPGLHAKGLGVHLTTSITGQTFVGPNAFYIDQKNDYHHQSSVDEFAACVAHYLPDQKIKLHQAYSGNRPKLYFKDELIKDFVIQKQKNWIHLLGIESPGLTAAPAIAKHVLEIM